MAAYYNEHDPFAAAWLRNLIAAGHIAPGEVDERSIVAVRSDDLRGFTQCHFFAGIGVWSYALRLAGWPDDRPVWTGSCPCQPFSVAGKGEADADDRHLWPEWFRLISECGPPVVFGEQVGAAVGIGWLDDVLVSMEHTGYACGAVDFPACSVGAPHIRQRVYFVAESEAIRRQSGQEDARIVSPRVEQTRGESIKPSACGEDSDLLADSKIERCGEERTSGGRPSQRVSDGGEPYELADSAIGPDQRSQSQSGVGTVAVSDGKMYAGLVGDAYGERRRIYGQKHQRGENGRACASVEYVQLVNADESRCGQDDRQSGVCSETNCERQTNWSCWRGDSISKKGFWSTADWLPCRDGKLRPVEPGTFPLAHGAPARVGRLRGYGNAIVAPQAAEFIGAYMDTVTDSETMPPGCKCARTDWLPAPHTVNPVCEEFETDRFSSACSECEHPAECHE